MGTEYAADMGHDMRHTCMLKLTFPCAIGRLSLDGNFKSEIGTASLGQTVGVLSPSMFNADSQP